MSNQYRQLQWVNLSSNETAFPLKFNNSTYKKYWLLSNLI